MPGFLTHRIPGVEEGVGSFLLIHSRGSGRLTCPRSQLVGQCGDLKFPSIDFVSRQLLFRGRGAGTEPEGGGGESSTPPSPASALALAGPSRPAQRKRLSAARRCQREASSLAEPRWRFCYSKAPGGERGGSVHLMGSHGAGPNHEPSLYS